MTPEERVRTLNVSMSGGCGCNTCEEARGRLIAAIRDAEREAVQACREQKAWLLVTLAAMSTVVLGLYLLAT